MILALNISSSELSPAEAMAERARRVRKVDQAPAREHSAEEDRALVLMIFGKELSDGRPEKADVRKILRETEVRRDRPIEDRYEEIMSFYELNSQSSDYLVEEAMIQLEEYISCFEAQMTKKESQGLF